MNFLHATAPAGAAVTVSARLHLGFPDLNGEFGRRFGSLGLSISEPRGRLTLRRASAARVR
jgi:predicted sugar kinase